MQFTRTANHKLHALNSYIAIGLFFHLAINFFFFFQQLRSPETAVFPHSPVRLPLIAHSQSNLQFQFTKAIAIQLYFRQITLFCQFKLVNIGLQLILIYYNTIIQTIQLKCEYERGTRKHHCLIWLVPQHKVYT